MLLTDQSVINSIKEYSGSMQDGLTVFIAQGRYAVDVCCYSDNKEGINLFVVDVYGRKEECVGNDTFYDISYIDGKVMEEFNHELQLCFTTQEEANAHILKLMVEHSPF